MAVLKGVRTPCIVKHSLLAKPGVENVDAKKIEIMVVQVSK